MIEIFTVSFLGDREIRQFSQMEERLQDDNSVLVRILPYLAAEYWNDEEFFLQNYDKVELCQSSAEAHFKAATLVRNREMVNRSDLIV